jgi:hypothetical protein
MTLSVVGETHNGLNPILTPDWFRLLQPNQLAAYIRYSYIWRQKGTTQLDKPEQTKRVPRWDGGEDSFGCKFTPVWPRIVKMITACDADPGAWVAAHFSPVAVSKYVSIRESFEVRDISPTQLCSKNSEQIYQEYCEFMPGFIQQNYETAGRTINLRLKSLAKFNLSKTDQYACVICDEGYVTAPPFFRHGFADLFQARDAAEKFLWPAAFEYESNQRLYSRVVEWCITKPLLSAVEEIRMYWRQG